MTLFDGGRLELPLVDSMILFLMLISLTTELVSLPGS